MKCLMIENITLYYYMCTINFLKDSQRFAGQLLQSYSFFGSPLPQSFLPSLFLFSIFLKLDYCSF